MLIGYVRVSARRPRRCPSCSQPAPSRQVSARKRHQRSLYEVLARIVAMARLEVKGLSDRGALVLKEPSTGSRHLSAPSGPQPTDGAFLCSDSPSGKAVMLNLDTAFC